MQSTGGAVAHTPLGPPYPGTRWLPAGAPGGLRVAAREPSPLTFVRQFEIPSTGRTGGGPLAHLHIFFIFFLLFLFFVFTQGTLDFPQEGG